MKTIESLSTHDLENWMRGIRPPGDIQELERSEIEYACRVELYSRNGGWNKNGIPVSDELVSAQNALEMVEDENSSLQKEIERLEALAKEDGKE